MRVDESIALECPHLSSKFWHRNELGRQVNLENICHMQIDICFVTGDEDEDDVKHASSPEAWLVLHIGPRLRAMDCSRRLGGIFHSDPCKPRYKRSNGCTFWRRCKVISTAHILAQKLTCAQVFEQLKKPIDPKVIEQREHELNERAHEQYERAQQRQAEIVSPDGTNDTMDIV